jgi:hypothetical protein
LTWKKEEVEEERQEEVGKEEVEDDRGEKRGWRERKEEK